VLWQRKGKYYLQSGGFTIAKFRYSHEEKHKYSLFEKGKLLKVCSTLNEAKSITQ